MISCVVVFTRNHLHCPTAAKMSCQVVPQQVEAIQFWVHPSVRGYKLSDLPWSHFGRLVCCPKLILSLCYLSYLYSPRVQVLAQHLFSRASSVFNLSPLLVLDYSLLFMFFSFGGWFSLPRGYTRLWSWGLGRGVACGMCCSPVESAGSCRHLLYQPLRRNGMLLFSSQTLSGTGFSVIECREAFLGLGFKVVTEFDSGWCSIFCLL
jgi:hypothetical protein